MMNANGKFTKLHNQVTHIKTYEKLLGMIGIRSEIGEEKEISEKEVIRYILK